MAEVQLDVTFLNSSSSPEIIDKWIELEAESSDEEIKSDATPG